MYIYIRNLSISLCMCTSFSLPLCMYTCVFVLFCFFSLSACRSLCACVCDNNIVKSRTWFFLTLFVMMLARITWLVQPHNHALVGYLSEKLADVNWYYFISRCAKIFLCRSSVYDRVYVVYFLLRRSGVILIGWVNHKVLRGNLMQTKLDTFLSWKYKELIFSSS